MNMVSNRGGEWGEWGEGEGRREKKRSCGLDTKGHQRMNICSYMVISFSGILELIGVISRGTS